MESTSARQPIVARGRLGRHNGLYVGGRAAMALHPPGRHPQLDRTSGKNGVEWRGQGAAYVGRAESGCCGVGAVGLSWNRRMQWRDVDSAGGTASGDECGRDGCMLARRHPQLDRRAPWPMALKWGAPRATACTSAGRTTPGCTSGSGWNGIASMRPAATGCAHCNDLQRVLRRYGQRPGRVGPLHPGQGPCRERRAADADPHRAGVRVPMPYPQATWSPLTASARLWRGRACLCPWCGWPDQGRPAWSAWSRDAWPSPRCRRGTARAPGGAAGAAQRGRAGPGRRHRGADRPGAGAGQG